VRLEFSIWTERMRTPKVQADAIRALQGVAPADVLRHFAIGPDGSFDLDVALFRASRPRCDCSTSSAAVLAFIPESCSD